MHRHCTWHLEKQIKNVVLTLLINHSDINAKIFGFVMKALRRLILHGVGRGGGHQVIALYLSFEE